VVLREGRRIFMQTTDDAEQHERFVRDFLAQRPYIEAQRDEYLARLQDILAEVDPAACVAYASLTYLQKDPDTYRESTDDQSPAHVEFLALQALPVLGESRSASSPAIREQPLSAGSWIEYGSGSLAVLPYETVRGARDPRTTLLAFCQSAYEAGARLAGWDTISVESKWCPTPGQLNQLHASAAAEFGRPSART
jgi:Family of unknown function (DUF5996)